MKKNWLLFFMLVSLCACQNPRDEKAAIIKNMPAKKIENYRFDLRTPVAERIYEAPPVLLAYLNAMDGTDRYSKYMPIKEEAGLVGEYLSYLPVKMQRTLEEKLIGMYFIKNLAGGGMADYVFDSSGALFSILVLNPDVLSISLQNWVAYRDNSTFETSRGIKTRNSLGLTYKGLLHTLWHEASHIYDYFSQVTPYTEDSLHMIGLFSSEPTPFVEDVWTDYQLPEKKYDFNNRDKITAYGLGPRLLNQEMVGMYNSLAKTPFVSLYASQNWAEDFAETFTWFYMLEKFAVKYEVTIYAGDSPVFTFSPLDAGLPQERYARIKKSLE